MKKIILISCLIAASVFATDYSNMSTEEMMNLRGSVPSEDRDAFRSEMRSRVQNMSDDERSSFMQNRPQGQGSRDGSGSQMRRGSGGGMGQGMGRGRH